MDQTTSSIYQAYLQGALHDGTYSHLHKTHRICQKGTDWLEQLQTMLCALGHRSWIYQEGKTRSVYALETTASFLSVDFDPSTLLTSEEKIAYARGYFDAEGGLPQTLNARFYIQLTQKNFEELGKLKAILEEHQIVCGQIHNPSVRVDPDYWRFFVLTQSHSKFASLIGSWHPRKASIFELRVMI